MKKLMPLLFVYLATCLWAAPDIQTSEGRDAERARLELERADTHKKFDTLDFECQTRFIVTSCREEVKVQRIRSLDALQRQENVLNRMDRKAAATKQQKKLDEKMSSVKPSTKSDSKSISKSAGHSEQEKSAKRAAYDEKQQELAKRIQRRDEGLRELADKQQAREKEITDKAARVERARLAATQP